MLLPRVNSEEPLRMLLEVSVLAATSRTPGLTDRRNGILLRPQVPASMKAELWECFRTAGTIIVTEPTLHKSLRLANTARTLQSEFEGALRNTELDIPGGVLLNLLGVAVFVFR